MVDLDNMSLSPITFINIWPQPQTPMFRVSQRHYISCSSHHQLKKVARSERKPAKALGSKNTHCKIVGCCVDALCLHRLVRYHSPVILCFRPYGINIVDRIACVALPISN